MNIHIPRLQNAKALIGSGREPRCDTALRTRAGGGAHSAPSGTVQEGTFEDEVIVEPVLSIWRI